MTACLSLATAGLMTAVSRLSDYPQVRQDVDRNKIDIEDLKQRVRTNELTLSREQGRDEGRAEHERR